MVLIVICVRLYASLVYISYSYGLLCAMIQLTGLSLSIYMHDSISVVLVSICMIQLSSSALQSPALFNV